MKIIQRILSKGILITLAIAAGLVYYYRVDLFPQWYAQKDNSGTVSTTKTVTMTAPQESETLPAAATEAPAFTSTDVASPVTENNSTGADTPATDESSAQDKSLPQDHTNTDEPATSDSLPVVESTPAGTNETDNPGNDTQNAATTDPEPGITVPEIVAGDVTIPVASAAQLMSQARNAYWQKDHARAEEIYQQAAKLDSRNPDLYGELGNLYFSQGKWQQAADAYYAAGLQLIEQGKSDRVRHLVTVLKGLDSVQAEKLEKSIAQ